MSRRIVPLVAASLIALASGCGNEEEDQDQELDQAISKLEKASEGSTPRDQAAESKASAPAVVRQYLRRIDANDFAGAWSFLDPNVQEGFGGYEAWRTGYRSNQSTVVSEARVVASSGASSDLTVRIEAVDRCDGETYEQTFEGPWSVDTSRQRVTSADFSLIEGDPPPTGCVG